MLDRKITIEIPSSTSAEGNQKIVELQGIIENTALSLGVLNSMEQSIEKNRSDTLDFGASLVVVLGTPAAIAIAKGIYNFITKYGDSVVVTTDEGTVVARGSAAANIDVAATVAALHNKAARKK